ncbi:uncharacterized protein LOC127838952 isoform X3 [Dreissena polymorpha]|uniref:NADH dehydrogenase n=1 Tax=Dreissena polymorpha TaxID=45954 RepID=A0A9D4N0L8_DREPO|nr:uncharacterized protein LOC127838952 isoform X3 [Dreissena polymorpha]KAH3885109.1 hypothetical protein DPMN_009098 [Dreissena polymorpha]
MGYGLGSILEPVRNFGFRKLEDFHLSRATGIDFTKHVVHCESALKPGACYDVEYDRLVIGVGSLSNTYNTPGVAEHAFFLKEVGDARKIRNKILSNFELATQPTVSQAESDRLLHIVIVGGGPTGVEFGAEVYDFVEQDVARLYKGKKDSVRVTLVESNKILGSFDKRLQKFAEKQIQSRRGFTLARDLVTGVYEDHVVLKTGGKLPCGLVVWSTGLAPREFVRDMDIPKNPRGQILTNRSLQVQGDPTGQSYALGDCADIVDMPLPCTAQVAERQGRYLALLLNNRTSEEFKFFSAGMLAYIGGYQGLTDLPQGKLQGFPSWFLWRSAYLTQLGSWRLRMQVPVDWTKTLLFGRDISRLE